MLENNIFKYFSLAGMGLFLSLLMVTSGFAEVRKNQKFDDWLFHCTETVVQAPNTSNSTEEPSTEACALYQSLAAENRPRFGLVILIEEFKPQQNTPQNIIATIKILAPLGVLLTSGILLEIDDERQGLTPFFRCLPNGCTSVSYLDKATWDKLIAGNTAFLTLFLTPEDGLTIPVKLKGLKAGFAALKN